MSPEVNQAKKHQVGILPDAFIHSLLGEICPHCKKECTLESKALQCDFCGIWVHAECEGISSELYDNFNHVLSSVNNVS